MLKKEYRGKLKEYIKDVFEYYGDRGAMLDKFLNQCRNKNVNIFIEQNHYHSDYKLPVKKGANREALVEFDFWLKRFIEESKACVVILNYLERLRDHQEYPKVNAKCFYLDGYVFYLLDTSAPSNEYSKLISKFSSLPDCCLITKYDVMSLAGKEISHEKFNEIIQSTIGIVLDLYDGDSFLHIDLIN